MGMVNDFSGVSNNARLECRLEYDDINRGTAGRCARKGSVYLHSNVREKDGQGDGVLDRNSPQIERVDRAHRPKGPCGLMERISRTRQKGFSATPSRAVHFAMPALLR